MLQLNDGHLEELRPGSVPPIAPLGKLEAMATNFDLNFKERTSLDSGNSVYSLALTIPGTPWVLVQETIAEQALEELQSYIQTIAAIAILVVIAVIVAFGAFWWRMTSDHNRPSRRSVQRNGSPDRSAKAFCR